MNIEKQSKSDPYAVLRIADYRNLQVARFALTFAIQMAETILGWKVYEITHDKLALGLIGLSEALPFILTSFYSGHAADTFNRYRIVKRAMFVLFLCFMGIAFLLKDDAGLLHTEGIYPVYILLGLSGIARAFMAPCMQAIMPQILPRNLYANGATWNSNIWQTAAVTGPAFGGLLYGMLESKFNSDVGEIAVFSLALTILLLSLFAFNRLRVRENPPKEKVEAILESLKAGIRFVFHKEEMLAAISLDLFAVLFGGAIALLPVFASDILHVGPEGLGLLRAAPFFGSVIMGLFLAHYPPVQNAGRNLFISVACFGLAIIGFAFSRDFYLSISLLFLTGLFDSVSVVIRGTILQVMTPDNMRGRVGAVNQMFISSSNEIGAFESGLAAKLMGTVPSVIFGGSMTLLVVVVVFLLSPKMRKLKM
ncbi:MAG: MFS transporter [Bacteroidetes bacterium]|nr:MFS transporter [Bacteroidota bacterium]